MWPQAANLSSASTNSNPAITLLPASHNPNALPQDHDVYIYNNSGSMPKPRTRLKSCEHCRRHRLRCDRIMRAPQPCSICWKRGIDCVFTSQGRNDDGALNASHELTGSPVARHADQTLPVAIPPSPVHHNGTDREDHMRTTEPTPLVRLYEGPTQQFGNLAVTATQINEHFQYFFHHMNPNFPFIATPCSISETLRISPLLFWTVITIACTHRDRTLYKALQPFVRSLVAGVLHPSGHGVETCQAICLICLWPLEAQEPNDDPSYLYGGLVSHLALKMGLHRAEFSHEYTDITKSISRQHQENYARLNTWYACQFVEHMLAYKTGVPSGIRLDWSSQLKLKSTKKSGESVVSSIVTQHLQICGVRDRHLNIISYDGHTPSGLQPPGKRLDHLKIFHAALEVVEASESRLESLSQIFLNMTRVNLAGLCLARDMLQSYRDECYDLILSGLHAAASILNLVAPLAWETLPIHILRSVLYAGVFAAHLQKMDMDLSVTVKPSALLERSVDILRHLAYGNDFPTRAKIVLETKLNDHVRLPLATTQLQSFAEDEVDGIAFRSRMEANMYWDLVDSDRTKHNWNQNAEEIYQELLTSGMYLFSEAHT